MDGDGLGVGVEIRSPNRVEVIEKFSDTKMMRILSKLDTKLSKVTLVDVTLGLGDMRKRLEDLQGNILVWDCDESTIWDSGPDEAFKYLQAVDEVRRLTEMLETFQRPQDDRREVNELFCSSHTILQAAMAKLEEELIHLLVNCHRLLNRERTSFHSSDEDFADDHSRNSFGEDSSRKGFRGRSRSGSEEYIIDLISPVGPPDAKCIVELMFVSKYDMECCRAYIDVRRAALEECLSFVRAEKLSVEEILQMDWDTLDSSIKKWIRAAKVFVRVYLASEKRFCDYIFGGISESVAVSCFVESAKESVLRIINFAEAVAAGPLLPERLFRVLDLYELMSDILPDMEAMFPKDSECFIMDECHEVLWRLRDSVRGMINRFNNNIQHSTSTTGFAGGGIHPLTKYVMNYNVALADYKKSLDLILVGQNNHAEKSSSPSAGHFSLTASLLESSLQKKSLLYQEESLQHLFLMNNICYMVRKVKGSDLLGLLGDEWVREHDRMHHKHAYKYERSSWHHVLEFLKDEGISNSFSRSPSKTILKDRFKRFNHAFEEVYKAQTSWHVPDADLREDLRISIAQNVLQAYWTFIGRYGSHLDGVRHRERYIKYSLDDLQNYLIDLFEGSPKSL